MEKEYWGKYGLKGTCGFVPLEVNGEISLIHIASSYDADDKVFVSEIDHKWGEIWTRKTIDDAQKSNAKIIKCNEPGCDEPAVQLDHYWPYDSMMNACERHILHDMKAYGERAQRAENASSMKKDRLRN